MVAGLWLDPGQWQVAEMVLPVILRRVKLSRGGAWPEEAIHDGKKLRGATERYVSEINDKPEAVIAKQLKKAN